MDIDRSPAQRTQEYRNTGQARPLRSRYIGPGNEDCAMSLINRALFIIERNLHHELSLGGIAEWRRFMAEFYPRIQHKSETIPLGIVSSGSEGDTELSYTCAVEVSRFNTF